MRRGLRVRGFTATALAAALIAVAALAAPNTGKLRFVQAKVDAVDLNGVNDLESCRGGRNLYVASYDANALVSFDRKRRSGKLRAVDVERNDENVTDMGQPGDVVCSRDGEFVYVTSDEDEAILAFTRNQRTGKLRFKHRKTDSEGRLENVYGLIASPDGRFLHATASATESHLLTFRRNPRNGRLALRDLETDDAGLENAGTPVVSADGANLYLPGNDAISTYDRNLRTGRLRFVNVKADGVGDIDGLGGTFGVDVSRDGRNVYATGLNDDAIVTFKRNRRNGKLKFMNAHFDGGGAGDLFDSPYVVIVSQDGESVYAAASADEAVNVFKRKKSGRLSLLQAKPETDLGPFRMELARDDRFLYSGGYDGDNVTVYKRKRR